MSMRISRYPCWAKLHKDLKAESYEIKKKQGSNSLEGPHRGPFVLIGYSITYTQDVPSLSPAYEQIFPL